MSTVTKTKRYFDEFSWWHGRKRVKEFREDLPIHTIRVNADQLRSNAFPLILLKQIGMKGNSSELLWKLRESQILTVRDLDPIYHPKHGHRWRFTFQIIWPEEEDEQPN